MKSWRTLTLVCLAVLGTFLLTLPAPTLAQDPSTPEPDPPPFSLPFDTPPGPDTWLYEQHYGNSTSAFNYGNVWYSSGQGMHFGVDLEAPCGTPVLAIADGVVRFVDAEGFGAGPHNLIIDHPGTGYSSLYGHLGQVPDLQRGQEVRRGEQIAITGDPDRTCESRPHLHLEIRNPDFTVAYNPLPLIDANWHMITSIGPYTNTFQQDLEHPYRWMTLEDQPDIRFGGSYLNRYTQPWPPKLELRAPINAPASRTLTPLPDDVAVTQTPVALEQWNIAPWWRPGDNDAVYLIDAVPGEGAAVFRQPLDGSDRVFSEQIPPTYFSPNGDVTVRHIGNGTMQITRLADGAQWEVYTNGSYPSVSPDGSRLLWEVLYGEVLPGANMPGLEVWISNLDGELRRRVYTQSGGWSMWLDDHRLLIVKRILYTADTQLYILDVDDPAVTPFLLGEYRFLRGLQVAPGGEHIAFYLAFQDDATANGVYVQPTQEGTTPQKLPFFGAYQWRDDQSLFTLSFDITTDAHALGLVDINSAEHRLLTDPADLPLRVANGDWAVSPDGQSIVYVDPADYGLYLLTMETEETE